MNEVSETQPRTSRRSLGRSISPSRRRHRALLFALVTYVLAAHGGLFAYDVLHKFAPFLGADRAQQRVDAMTSLLNSGTWRDVHHALIDNNLIIGEYIVQTGLYVVGGALAIVLFQVLLQLLAVLAVFRVALLVLDSVNSSVAAALVYASLPHSLVFPHQLSSEAIGIPVMVIGYWLFFEYRVGGKSIAYLWAAGAMFGLAACVRPQLLLLPIMLAPFAIRTRSAGAMAGAVSFIAAGLLPVMLWVAVVWSGTGHPSLGNGYGSLDYNLYLRVLRISHSVPPAERTTMTDRYLLDGVSDACAASLRSYLADPRNTQGPAATCTLSLPRYMSFVAHYPAASLRDLLRDIFTLATKSGMSKLTIDYFNPSLRNRVAIQSLKYGWRTIWESQGLLAAIRSVAKVNLVAVVAELGAAAAFFALFLSFLFGLIIVARRAFDRAFPGERRVGLGVLAVHALYILMTTLAADAAQSRHRYPAEFAMSILAVLGATTAFTLYREPSRRRLRTWGCGGAAPG